ncbi:hypothetical protein E8E12_003359 [Didymella heteroderae]|uniref:Uncharacterized protein n=1 Tax=Didymella heteroderae TaxID=1769908 RepID=A0A9P5C271_9PLEO|nr:hypothetical protein E8E12_003359 [Didymella heteroderae]
MVVATFLEDILGLILKYPRLSSTRLAYAHAEWQAESTLQLHRLAQESLGLGTWKRTDEAVPVTHLGDILAVLDVANPKHACMVVPSEELEGPTASQRSASVRARAKYERVPSGTDLL